MFKILFATSGMCAVHILIFKLLREEGGGNFELFLHPAEGHVALGYMAILPVLQRLVFGQSFVGPMSTVAKRLDGSRCHLAQR